MLLTLKRCIAVEKPHSTQGCISEQEVLWQQVGHGGDDNDTHDDDHGLPAYSHHDKIPPWWEYVSNDKGGNVSVTKSHHT